MKQPLEEEAEDEKEVEEEDKESLEECEGDIFPVGKIVKREINF
jgi:hypothetical protein